MTATDYTAKNNATMRQQFLIWWKLHTGSYPVRSDRGVVDSGGLVGISENGIDVRKCHFNVTDLKLTEFPFKMNSVDHFTIIMPELQSMKNCPVDAMVSAQYGSINMPMRYLDNISGCPKRTKSLSIVTEMPILDLKNQMVEQVEDIILIAPEFVSVSGLTVDVMRLTLNAQKQKTFKGIHKQIRSNVKSIAIGVGPDFAGGVLSFAMLDSSIVVIPDVAGNPPVGFAAAIDIVAESRTEGVNIHDIQERLIDAGFGKYAQL